MPFQAALLSIKPAPAARSAATKFLFWGTGAAAEATCAKALRAECPLGEEKDYGPGPGIWHKSPETVGAYDPSSFQKHAEVAGGSPLPGSLAAWLDRAAGWTISSDGPVVTTERGVICRHMRRL